MAKESYWQFDTDPDLNTDIGGLDVNENCDPANVNNSIRRLMAEAKKYVNDTSGKLVSGGTGTAYTLTTESTLTAYADGIRLAWIVNTDGTGAATLNVNAIGAKALRKDDDQALVSGDLQAGMVAEAVYDASANAAAGAWLLTRTYANLAAYITASSTDTLTNKTIVASSNTISALAVSMFAAAAVVTAAETINANDVDTAFPTAAAVRAHAVGLAVSNQWAALTEKVTLVDADLILIEDSEASGAKKKVQKANLGSGTAAATQAEMETGTSVLVASTPGRQHFHPGHPKVWCKANSAGAISASYNMTSVTDDGTGQITFTIATDFSSANWGAFAMVHDTGQGTTVQYSVVITAQSAGAASAVANSQIEAGDVSVDDPTAWFFMGLGDQA